jgi:hypothetical protein
LRQRIVLFKVRVKRWQGELLHARGVVGRGVLRAWDVSRDVVVSVGPLVVAGQLAEVCCWSRGGHGSFLDTGHSRGVVAEVFQSGIAHGVAVSHDISLGNEACVFQIAVGDVARGIGGADEGCLDVRWEGMSPVVPLARVVEVDASHASLGSVCGSNQSW